MEQPTESSMVQGEGAAPEAAVSLGKVLREAREHLGLSVADAAYQTKLAPRQIEALEAEDFRSLPEMPFVRGFVRSYAKILQLDAQPLLAALPQTNAPVMPLVPNSVEVPFPNAHSPQRQNLVWLGAALLLAVLVVAFAVWNFTTPSVKPGAAMVETPVSSSAKPQIPPAAPVVDAGAIAPPAEPVQPHAPDEKAAAAQDAPRIQPEKPVAQSDSLAQAAVLRLTFDEESWVEIKGVDDKVLSSQINPRGSELRMGGQAPFSLVIGNATSVQLYYRGKQVDLASHTRRSTNVAYLTLE